MSYPANWRALKNPLFLSLRSRNLREWQSRAILSLRGSTRNLSRHWRDGNLTICRTQIQFTYFLYQHKVLKLQHKMRCSRSPANCGTAYLCSFFCHCEPVRAWQSATCEIASSSHKLWDYSSNQKREYINSIKYFFSTLQLKGFTVSLYFFIILNRFSTFSG